MQVTSSGPQTIQRARGEKVTIGCTYTPGPEDTGELDIEWSNVSPDMTQKDTLVSIQILARRNVVRNLSGRLQNLLKHFKHSEPNLSFSFGLCTRGLSSLNGIFASQILSYSGGQTVHYGDPSLSERLSFTGDPKQGDASVTISDVKISDTATYQCKVKKTPGVDMRKVTLVVMGEEKISQSVTPA